MSNLVVCLMGPTASGKTKMAIDLAKTGRFEIINVDSAQIYKQMDIGTGKPDFKTLLEAPHRLLDFIDPSEAYSVGEFCKDAKREIEIIKSLGKIPLLVGGTMMYFNALQNGMAELPSSDPDIRSRLERESETETGRIKLHDKLKLIDAKSAQKIHYNDKQRLTRSLEVFEITGQSISQIQANTKKEVEFDFLNVAIIPSDRAALHQKIEDRFLSMLDQGLVAEVQFLFNRGDLDSSMNSIRCVGYRQVWQFLEKKIDYQEMQDKAIIATRQLAKRQLTWLRSWENSHEVTKFEDVLDLI